MHEASVSEASVGEASVGEASVGEASCNASRTCATVSHSCGARIFVTCGAKEGEETTTSADGPTAEVVVSSPSFAPQVTKILAPQEWLTVAQVREALR